MHLQDNDHLVTIIQNAPIGICTLDAGKLTIETVNDKFLEIAGKSKEALVGKWYWDPFAEARAYYEAALDSVIKTGKPYYADEVELMLIRHGLEEMVFVTFVYIPVLNAAGSISKVVVWVLENTMQVKSRQAINQLNDELSAANQEIAAANEEFVSINEELLTSNEQLITTQAALQQLNETLAESDTRFRRLTQESPVAIFVLKGRDMVFETVNDLMYRMLGKGSEILGKPYAVAVPELIGQPFFDILDQVFLTGKTFYGYEIKGTLEKNGQPTDGYFNFIYQAIKDDSGKVTGIMCVAIDVIEQVNAREVISNINDRLNIAMDAGKFGTTEVELATGKMICNERFKNLFGRTKDQEMTYPDMFAAMLPKYRENIRARSRKAQQEHSLYEATYEIAWPDGSLHWIEAHGRARYDQDGKPDRMVGILADVTEQVTARKALQESEEKLKIAIETGKMGTWSIDIPTQKPTLSEFVRNMLGIPLDVEVTMEMIMTAIKPEYHEMLLETLKDAVENGRSSDSEYAIVNLQTSEEKWVKATATVLLNSEGKPLEYTGIFMDITERKLDELRKNDFIGMVSHELKTPLTSLTAYIQMLKVKAQKAEDTFTTGALDQSVKQVKRMTTMINGFLNISRLESGKISIHPQRFDMADLVKESEAETIPMYSSHQIIFTTVEPILVIADRDKIGQVINNLISNAVKYSKSGSTINVACVTADLLAIVSVKDQGMGIEPEEFNKLFERYYRVEANNNISGFGIGLYLCKEIVERHHGKIWVESEPEKGSTFFFSIPVAAIE